MTITSYPVADRISASSVRTESKRSKSYERCLPCYRQWQRKWLNEFKGTNSASAFREYPGVFQREVSYWDRRFQIPKSVFSSDRGDRYSFNGQIASTLQNTFFSRTRVATKKIAHKYSSLFRIFSCKMSLQMDLGINLAPGPVCQKRLCTSIDILGSLTPSSSLQYSSKVVLKWETKVVLAVKLCF